MTFSQKISAYTLGFLFDKDLPDIAMTGLEEGRDSESLRILAGHNTTDNSFLLNEYFIKVLQELRLVVKDRKESLKDVISYYATNIVNKKSDTYLEVKKLNEIISKTEFYYDDLDLMPCYADYISIWEEKMDGLDFHTAEGLTKE